MSQAARLVDLPSTWDITNTASRVSLQDATSESTISSHVVQVTGTWTGTLIFEGTLGTPGTGTYVALGYVTVGDPGTLVTAGTFTANGIFKVQADGMSDVSVRVSIAGTGTPVIRASGLRG